MSLILKNSCFIDWESLSFTNTHVKVEEGKDGSIMFYDNFEEIPLSPEDEIIDCQGKYVTKSFAVGHHHAYSALARGMPASPKTPSGFLQILHYIWWNIDKALDREMIEASAYATAIACARAGSTFVIDHHSSPNYIHGSLQTIADAFEKVGVSHLLCYEISNRDGTEKAMHGLKENSDYLEKYQGLVGLHASFTLEESTLQRAVELMREKDSGIHIHVAEDKYDQEHSLHHFKKRVIERLNDAGVLDSSKTILAHCLHINENERDIINKSPVHVVQNTESNLNNKVGFFNSKGLGNRIMLGTDGMHSDMIRSAQASYFVGQSNDQVDLMSTYKRLREAHNYLSLNKFSGDGKNNLLVLDYKPPTVFDENNFFGHFIFGLTSDHVQHVISNGKLIVKDKIIQTVNEDEVLEFAREQSTRLWSRL